MSNIDGDIVDIKRDLQSSHFVVVSNDTLSTCIVYLNKISEPDNIMWIETYVIGAKRKLSFVGLKK